MVSFIYLGYIIVFPRIIFFSSYLLLISMYVIISLGVSLDLWLEEVMMIFMEEELTQEKMQENMKEMQEIVKRSIPIIVCHLKI